ncbi:GNAT family N-acetyltransferase [Brevundimonas variabilis]|uniref:RimJ/RimL family protein N-acetyltransferase n=1 Tax=Brevundimonas variabilis TaxID=74312 RepID=A0A7W9CGT6_9CAUL|nr:RimJ/RimL family protein N-acetyltransferase [Brevundimonas variabilis]
MKIEPTPLENDVVRLEPYADAIRNELREALNVDPDSWNLLAGSAFGPAFDVWWTNWTGQQAAGQAVCYAVRDQATGRLVGTTALFEVQPKHRRLELGATFYRPEARGHRVNPACKRLLLGHAFAAGAVRVEILTDALNLRSRAAIARLGAVEEGILRAHKITHTGRVRDTVMFSILHTDWPNVREQLDSRLAPAAT